MPNEKKVLCNISVSTSTTFGNHWALQLAPRCSEEDEEIIVQCQFAGHDMMSEEAMNNMMDSMAHTTAEEYRKYLELEKEKKKAREKAANERIAECVVEDFFNKAKGL